VSEEESLPEQIRVRHEKRDRLIAQGREPFPVSVPRTHSLADVRAKWGNLGTGEETADVVSVTGRIVFIRNTGKLCFATLQEGLSETSSGERLQIMLSLAEVGEESLTAWKADVDLGDFVSVTGRVAGHHPRLHAAQVGRARCGRVPLVSRRTARSVDQLACARRVVGLAELVVGWSGVGAAQWGGPGVGGVGVAGDVEAAVGVFGQVVVFAGGGEVALVGGAEGVLPVWGSGRAWIRWSFSLRQEGWRQPGMMQVRSRARTRSTRFCGGR